MTHLTVLKLQLRRPLGNFFFKLSFKLDPPELCVFFFQTKHSIDYQRSTRAATMCLAASVPKQLGLGSFVSR